MLNRVVVLLTDEGLAQVKARAAGVPLSRWFRSLALSTNTREGIEHEPADGISIRGVGTWHRSPRQKGDKTR